MQGRAPSLLTSCAIIDLGVRASPQELHRNPPKLGDHCNGSQETMNARRPRPPLPTPQNTSPRCRAPNQRSPLAVRRPSAPYAPPTSPTASLLRGGFRPSAQTPPSPLPGPASKREGAPGASASRAFGSGLRQAWSQTHLWRMLRGVGQKILLFANISQTFSVLGARLCGRRKDV